MASPHPLLQGLIQKAAAPEERTAEAEERGLAPIDSAFHSVPLHLPRAALEPDLSCTSLFIFPRNMAVNKVNLLQVSIACKTRAHQRASRRGFQAYTHPSLPGPTPLLTRAIFPRLSRPPGLPSQL